MSKWALYEVCHKNFPPSATGSTLGYVRYVSKTPVPEGIKKLELDQDLKVSENGVELLWQPVVSPNWREPLPNNLSQPVMIGSYNQLGRYCLQNNIVPELSLSLHAQFYES